MTQFLPCLLYTSVEHLDVLHRVEETLNRHGVTTRDGITTMIWFAPDQLSDAFEELYVSNGGRLLYDACLLYTSYSVDGAYFIIRNK